MRVRDICVGIADGSHNPPQGLEMSDYLMLSSKNIFDDEITFDNPRYLAQSDFEQEDRRTKVMAGNVLLTIVGTVGRAAVVDEKMPPFTLQRSVAVLKPKADVCNSRYLMYALQGKRTYIENSAKGVAQKGIYLNEVSNIDLRIPALYEQESIVILLDKITAVTRSYQKQIQKLDELVKSRFVEMVGTYPNNPLRWETGRIRDIVEDVRYGSSRPAVEGGKYPYLRMNNITYSGELDLSDTKRIDVPENELEKCTVHRGDVLFNRTNSKELVGKTCVYNRDELMVLAGFVIRVRVTERVLPEFLSAFLNTDFSKQMLLGMCKAAIGQANINAQEMQDIGLYLPPVELQNQFVHFKAEVDKSKLAVKQSLEKLETLKKSLMQQYFG